MPNLNIPKFLTVAAIVSGCAGTTPKPISPADAQKEVASLRAEAKIFDEKAWALLKELVPIDPNVPDEVKLQLIGTEIDIHAACFHEGNDKASREIPGRFKIDYPPLYYKVVAPCKKFEDFKHVKEREECEDQERIKILTPEEAVTYFRRKLKREKYKYECLQNQGGAMQQMEKMPDPTVTLTDDNFEKEIAEGITIVDFYADWCEPCKIVIPGLTKIAKKYYGKVKVGRVDVDKNPKTANLIADKNGRLGLPTIHVYKNGAFLGELEGGVPGLMLEDTLFNVILEGKIKP